MFISAQQATGHEVTMLRNNPKHIDPHPPAAGSKGPEQSFGDLFINAFNDVNNIQTTASSLAQQMITDPDSVNVHDVTIAAAEANMAISMTKGIVDRALQAYREIINTR